MRFWKKTTDKKKTIEKETHKKEDKFKVRVEPHGSSTEWYCIKYKMQGSLIWNTYGYAYLKPKWSMYALERTHQPHLFRDFDEACDVAKTLTAEGIKQYNREQDEIWENHKAEIRSERAARNKTAEF